MSDDLRFEEVSYGAGFWAVLCLVTIVALVLVVRRARTDHRPSTLAWLAPLFALPAAIAAWYLCGTGASDVLALLAFCAVDVACAAVVVRRNEFVRLLPRGRRFARVFGATVACGIFALEFSWNGMWFTMMPQFWLVEALLVAGLLGILWLVFGRHGAGPALGIVALMAVGLVQHYVLEFRGTSILPSDIFALGTALSVSGGYTYGLSSGMLASFCALAVGSTCASLLHDAQAGQPRHTPLRDTAYALAMAGAMAALVLVPSYGAVFGANIDYWWSRDWYERQGFLPSFVYAWQDLAVKEPEGYTTQAAQEAQQALVARFAEDKTIQARRQAAEPQFTAAMPNLIVIQNETFCDLANFDGLANDYEGPQFWNQGMPDALMRGSFAVSVFGGGTCNTEFEFLTGNSLAFVGTAKYPFTMYDLSVTSSLPRQLGQLGYRTVGIHPNLASNWNRDRAYQQLGFQEFQSIDDFEGAEQFHTHVSDWATYERSLQLLQESTEPVFVFDVTMQNHSGYDTGSIPQDLLPGYRVRGLSADDTFQLNEYLACIQESDIALERLVQELQAIDEPTVVVMYGDHHPWFSQALNDLLFPNESDLAHAERIHQTTYVVWANYPVAGWDASESPDDTSADLLAASTLDALGAPLSDFQQAQLGARKDVRAINADGFLGADGNWRPLDEPGPYAQTLADLGLVEYLNFGSKV